jgi:valyl-tRNA synthetase
MYDSSIDEKWNKHWKEHRFRFDERSDRPVFSIDTPPPYPTGDLHIGQAFWVCYIDAMARYKHMKGFNVLYPQGWDMQGFPTEVAVEKKYGRAMQRTDFYNKCVEFTLANVERMKVQMAMLGASFDDRYEYFTHSPKYRRVVQLSLLQMYEKGMIYRTKHPIEWCPRCESSIAREEVDEVNEKSSLNYVEFAIEGAKDRLTIATTRPELLHAIVAVAVNPTDKRYKKLIGKSVRVPVFDKSVKVIGEGTISIEYGTGAEMVCTFGDKKDVMMYYQHKLGFVDALDEKGTLKNAGQFNGMHILKAREAVLDALKKSGALVRQEPIEHAVKQHDRCHTPIEMLSAMQWFIKTKDFADTIKEQADEIKWFPDTSKQRLYDWSDFIEWDWNISRHRIFGTPIPFWHCDSCDYIVVPQKSELPIDPTAANPPMDRCPKCRSRIVGESDVCDTWVDSSVTPLVVAGWPDNKELFRKLFPQTVRIQGTDIIRTWAFYTVFRTWAITGDKPFENLLTHGMILDSEGKEMHKSAGNGIAPEDLMKRYPVDAIRLWVALSGGLNKDKPFSYAEIDYAKSFMIKLENTAIFVHNIVKEMRLEKEPPHKDFGLFDLWILDSLNKTIKAVTESYDNYDLYEAMSRAIAFHWHEFADFYIEDVKHRVHSTEKSMEGSKKAAAYTLLHVFNASLRMLAPVMPHIAEELSAMFGNKDIFAEEFPRYYSESSKPSDYIINGVVFKSAMEDIDFGTIGVLLNNVIAEVRKAKARERLALNKEIASIIINVPEEYYQAAIAANDELMHICKAKAVQISKGEYSVGIKT